MRIALVYPRESDGRDGVADFTHGLAEALQSMGHQPINVTWQGRRPLRGTARMYRDLRRQSPDITAIQYSPFGWGRWGLNPILVALAAVAPGRRILVAHECFAPFVGSWRSRALAALQVIQFRLVGRRAHALRFSSQTWADRYGPWFPRADVSRMPIPSNIPASQLDRRQAKLALGLPATRRTLGFFGALDGHRDHASLTAALRAAADHAETLTVVYAGSTPEAFRSLAASCGCSDVVTPDTREPIHAADTLRAMDVAVCVFTGGVSERRGTFMALLQTGAAVVTNDGPLVTEPMRSAAGTAFLLVEPHEVRRAVETLLADDSRIIALSRGAEAIYASWFPPSAPADALLADPWPT